MIQEKCSFDTSTGFSVGSVYHASTRIHKEQDRVWRFAVLLLSDMIIILLRRIRMMCMCSFGMIRYRKNKE